MGNALDSLIKYLYHRRTDGNCNSNHSEEVSTNECSQFYLACRNNQIRKVKEYLRKMTLDQIDQIEPNGSTALHVASYRGYPLIVELLLKAGADRSIPNKYNCLPFDEAKNDQIKKLFLRQSNQNRFATNQGHILWDFINEDAFNHSIQERMFIKSIYDNITGTTSIETMFEKIEKNYIRQGLNNIQGIEHIQRFFQRATKELDPIWIIKAYTAETDFYKVLNTEIACGTTQYQMERKYLITLLYHHPKLNQFNFIGNSYRVVQMTDHQIKTYQINSTLMTKSFFSSSIDQKITEYFLIEKQIQFKQTSTLQRKRLDGTIIQSWVMFIYHIKHQRTALHIENISQYANEGEILIMPFTLFTIQNIQTIQLDHLPNNPSLTQIHLEEYQHY